MADEKGHQRTPVWDERPESLETFEQKAKLFKMSTKKEDRYLMAPKMLAAMPDDSRQFRNCVTIEDTVLSNPDGSGVDAILLRLRAKGGPRTVQGAVRLLKDLMNNKFLREKGESMRIWCNRFELQVLKTGKALKSVDSTIDATKFLHPIILGVMLLQATGLTATEEAAVLATSSGEGNSYAFDDIAESLQKQWSDEAVTRRDAHAPAHSRTVFGMSDGPDSSGAPHGPE